MSVMSERHDSTPLMIRLIMAAMNVTFAFTCRSIIADVVKSNEML